MDQFLRDPTKNTILHVGAVNARSLNYFFDALDKLEKTLGRSIKVVVVRDKQRKKPATPFPKEFTLVEVNTSSIIKLEEALDPYIDNLLLVSCAAESRIDILQKIIPHVPYLATPTAQSLSWAIDKIDMRRRLRVHDKSISPPYTIVHDSSEESLAKIKKKVGFPCVVKPASLAASALVSVNYYEQELVDNLSVVEKRIRKVYKERGRTNIEPKILVEGFMEGVMYSTDVYVNARGTMYVTPLVHIKTPFNMGLDDFYGYQQSTPVNLRAHKHQEAFRVAKEGVRALALRNITAHVELMKTEQGWKVIEIGPRMGGFRDFLYDEAYGIDHTLNDFLIRLPMRPIIPRKNKSYAMVMKMYGKQEGKIASIKGMKVIRGLESYKRRNLKKTIGDRNVFSRNGGGSVMDIYLVHKNRAKLLADARIVEKSLKIETAKR